MNREKVTALLNLVDSGCIDARDVLENVLVNYLSTDEAEDFIDSEYSEYFDDSDEWEEPEELYSTEDEDMNM